VADTINQADPTLEVRPRNTKGSSENVPLLEAGQLDLALGPGEVAHGALAGIGRAPRAGAPGRPELPHRDRPRGQVLNYDISSRESIAKRQEMS
jgi:hypothetical protein